MPALDRLVAERAESEDNGPALLNVLHRASFCGDDDIQRAITRHTLLISINTHTHTHVTQRFCSQTAEGVSRRALPLHRGMDGVWTPGG
jgi:hypothetical protein